MEVFGVVLDTDFTSGKLFTQFEVQSVQDDSIHLPEICRVPLEDLYPTVEQENSVINADITADCLDRFRFFFNYVYMPWDDDDSNFIGNSLFPRMKLFFDLKNKQLSKGLSSHIRRYTAEAKYIQNKRENLEDSIDERCDVDISHGENKDTARKLLELHLRMIKIKHGIDVLVNPEMRAIYEEVKFPHHELAKSNERMVFVVAEAGTLSEQICIIEQMKHKVANDTKIRWMSFHDAIAASGVSSEIYIPAGEQRLNFLEYLNGNVLLCGLATIDKDSIQMEQLHRYAKISAVDSGSWMLFAIDGDLRLQNLVIDCENVKTGFLVKDGTLSLKNCVIQGAKESSVTEAFAVSDAAQVVIEDCVIMNFATAITISGSAKVTIRNSVIKGCNNGIHLTDDESTVTMDSSSMLNCDESGILKYSTQLGDVKSKALDWNDNSEGSK